jgi:hypothetical protein
MPTRHDRPTPWVIAAALALAGCGGDDGPDGPPGDPAPHFDDGAMRIDVQSQPFAGEPATLVWGLLSTTPSPWPYDPPVVSGNCRMSLRHDSESCGPECAFGPDVCDAGVCRPLPEPQSAGPLTAAGGGVIRTIPFDMGYRFYLRQALFEPGAEITVHAPGADLPGFALGARLPEPIEVLGVADLQLEAGVALTLRWRPVGDGDRVRVILGADFGHAQLRSVLVECDLPDDAGQITIPQPMIDELADRSHWQCGSCLSQEVRRYRRADTALAGTTLSLWAYQAAYLALQPRITVP